MFGKCDQNQNLCGCETKMNDVRGLHVSVIYVICRTPMLQGWNWTSSFMSTVLWWPNNLHCTKEVLRWPNTIHIQVAFIRANLAYIAWANTHIVMCIHSLSCIKVTMHSSLNSCFTANHLRTNLSTWEYCRSIELYHIHPRSKQLVNTQVYPCEGRCI